MFTRYDLELVLVVGLAAAGCGGAPASNLFNDGDAGAGGLAAPVSSSPTPPTPPAPPADASTPMISDAAAPSDAADASTVVAPDAATEASAPPVDAAPSYFAAAFVTQSFPLATTALTMNPGETVPGFIELKNVGVTPWTSATRLATTEPRDSASPLADSTWLSPSRVVAVSGTVAAGETYRFSFNLHAPQTPGTYFQYFDLVDGNVWFGDPSQGGPPDDQLEIQVTVVAGGEN